jgi:hypothetical protein
MSMDEGRLSTELARAAQAERLLGDSILQDAISAVTTKYEKAWRESKPDDEEKRERAYLALRALSDLMREIERHVVTGKLAKAEIARKRQAN